MSYDNDFPSIPWVKIIFGSFLALIVIYGLGFLATGGDLAIYKFWAPKQENAKRQVFEQTQSYVEGKREYLTRLRLEYETADEGHKAALREMILSEAANVDLSKLPPDLVSFIQSLKNNQGGAL
jgi:hypothetical protein